MAKLERYVWTVSASSVYPMANIMYHYAMKISHEAE
jgi:hypothetical protein